MSNTNTIFGWVLFGGIAALGLSIASGKVFHEERPEKMGYPIEGVEAEGAEGAASGPPLATLLASADLSKGEMAFKKCAACHTISAGAANGIGPNLYATIGKPVGNAHPSFAYSDALKGVGGTWTFEAMNSWLTSPRKFAPGTKMTFAGLGDPVERANLIAWMNTLGSNLPLPAAPAAESSTAPAADAPAADAPADPAAAPAGEAPAEPAAAPAAPAPAAAE